MLLETLKLLVHAGEDALMTSCQIPVDEVTISQVGQGQITFPAIAKIEFKGGSLQCVRVGGDSMLCSRLAEVVDNSEFKSGIEHLARRFMTQAVEEMEGRHPRGHIVDLGIGPRSVFTRGTRSFGIKFRTSIGQLFLLAEVPSRLELEQAKGRDFLVGLAKTYMPTDWTSRDTLSSKSEIDSFLVLLRKVEGDVHIEVPQGENRTETRTGLLLEQCTFEGQRALRINLNLDQGMTSLLKVGDRVSSFVGVQERALEMDLEYLGAEDYPVTGGAVLQTAVFTLPAEIRVGQRRRAFRIDLPSSVPVELEIIDEDCTLAGWFGNQELGAGATGRLIDLSFSGARVIGEAGEFCATFPENTRVRCRIFFPDEPEPIQVLGLVRRSNCKLVGRDTYQDELGLEFLISADLDRASLDIIRQYVLREQRSLLARRVQVPG